MGVRIIDFLELTLILLQDLVGLDVVAVVLAEHFSVDGLGIVEYVLVEDLFDSLYCGLYIVRFLVLRIRHSDNDLQEFVALQISFS